MENNKSTESKTNERFDNPKQIEESAAALKEHYEELFKDKAYEGFNIQVSVNTRKADFNASSMTITMSKEGEKKIVSSTMYIIERRSAIAVVFVNNNNHSVIFSNISPFAIDKAEKYIIQFVQKNIYYATAPKSEAE